MDGFNMYLKKKEAEVFLLCLNPKGPEALCIQVVYLYLSLYAKFVSRIFGTQNQLERNFQG